MESEKIITKKKKKAIIDDDDEWRICIFGFLT